MRIAFFAALAHLKFNIFEICLDVIVLCAMFVMFAIRTSARTAYFVLLVKWKYFECLYVSEFSL